nr:MAG TPA: hypothetical protein [Caudoviricetes sp.]
MMPFMIIRLFKVQSKPKPLLTYRNYCSRRFQNRPTYASCTLCLRCLTYGLLI